MLTRFRIRSSHGFTLVETLAALMVFTIVTLGVIPLLTASLRGTNVARSRNVAKNLAVRAMERVRGLPYYIAFSAQPKDVDVLDIYHPGPGATTTTITCPTAGPPACPADIPNGYRLTFVSTFVASNGATPVTAAADSYNSNDETKDAPPASLLRMEVRVNWSTVGGRARNFALNTLIGDRAFGRLKVKGSGEIDYAIRVGTSFASPLARSDLTAIGGVSDSSIELRSNGAADQSVRGGELTLREANNGNVLASATGASADAHAPPSTNVADVPAGPSTISDPTIGAVAGLDSNEAGDPDTEGDIKVAVQGELPAAQGGFQFAAGNTTVPDFWINHPQMDRAALQLQNAGRLLGIQSTTNVPGGRGGLFGYTSSRARDVDAGVQSAARVDIEHLRLFPTDFIRAVDATHDGAVVVIQNFTSTLSCSAFADATAGAGSASISWSATVSYWEDTNPADGPVGGTYRSIDVAGTGPTTLAEVANVLVYDAPDDGAPNFEQRDIYLFATDETPRGYFQSWGSNNNVAEGADISDDGRSATAVLEGALRMDTAPIPTPGTLDEFSMSIILGSMSCEAVDFR